MATRRKSPGARRQTGRLLQRPVRVLSRRLVYRGYVFELIRERLRINGQTMVRESITHPGAVAVVPMIDRSHVVLVRQYRRAVHRTLWELPAGTRSPRERHLSCAKRELEEETGWRARRWTSLGRYYSAPGLLSEEMTLYLAQGLSYVGPRLEIDELLVPVVLPFREALEKVRSGTITDGKTIIGLLAAERRLRVTR